MLVVELAVKEWVDIQMAVTLSEKLIAALKSSGVTTFHRPGVRLPDDVIFEPPCSFKWMRVEHSIAVGAFSYAVNGYYFACRIGRYCSLGEDVQIGRHSHPTNWFSTSPFFYQDFHLVLDQPLPSGVKLSPRTDFSRRTPPTTLKVTHIDNDVYVGHGAFILPGVTIGTGAVVGACSVVTKDIPPYAIVAGSPARIVRYRFSERDIERLLASAWWDFAPWQLRGASVDDIPRFLDLVVSLREANTPVYAPKQIKLAELVAKDVSLQTP